MTPPLYERKKRWRLQIFWGGDWRNIMESDDRHMLVEYASRCADDLEMRIQDTNEEVKKNDRRH